MLSLSPSRTLKALLTCAAAHLRQPGACAAGVPRHHHSRGSRHRAGAQVHPAGHLPGEEAGHEGRVHAGQRLPGRGRGAGQQEGRPGLVRRLHLRAGAVALGRQDHPASRSARKTRKLPVGVHRQDRLGHQDAGRHEGQAGQLRLAEQHLGPPDAAQQPAAGRHRPGQGLQAHRLQRRARRDHRLGGQRQGRRGGAGHHGVAQVRRREQGRHQGRCDVFFTTPPYYNYNWSVHADMPAELRNKVQQGAARRSTRPRPRARRSCS